MSACGTWARSSASCAVSKMEVIKLAGLEPASVFGYFETLCTLPLGSGNTKIISDYLVSFAREQNIPYIQDELSFEEIRDRLNASLPAGVRVLEVYDSERKPKDLTLLDIAIGLEYATGIPTGCADAIRELFTRESVIVTKRGKNGPVDQDIIPMIFNLDVNEISSTELELTAGSAPRIPA